MNCACGQPLQRITGQIIDPSDELGLGLGLYREVWAISREDATTALILGESDHDVIDATQDGSWMDGITHTKGYCRDGL